MGRKDLAEPGTGWKPFPPRFGEWIVNVDKVRSHLGLKHSSSWVKKPFARIAKAWLGLSDWDFAVEEAAEILGRDDQGNKAVLIGEGLCCLTVAEEEEVPSTKIYKAGDKIRLVFPFLKEGRKEVEGIILSPACTESPGTMVADMAFKAFPSYCVGFGDWEPKLYRSTRLEVNTLQVLLHCNMRDEVVARLGYPDNDRVKAWPVDVNAPASHGDAVIAFSCNEFGLSGTSLAIGSQGTYTTFPWFGAIHDRLQILQVPETREALKASGYPIPAEYEGTTWREPEVFGFDSD